jgi:S-DNA-T family DNA segregation ATPase FtsK/SpoIIIE
VSAAADYVTALASGVKANCWSLAESAGHEGLRICFRVREPRDVDLILGQGMLRAGWDAHKLNAPGKFLVSAPEHDSPKRARSYEVKDEVVADTAARYANSRPELDKVSRQALTTPGHWPGAHGDHAPAGIPDDHDTRPETEDALWLALLQAPDEGTDIGELMRITGWKRTKLYRHLREHAEAGRTIQVSRGHWRARTTEEPSP